MPVFFSCLMLMPLKECYMLFDYFHDVAAAADADASPLSLRRATLLPLLRFAVAACLRSRHYAAAITLR